MGSGSTAVAAALEGRRFIGVERDQHWFEIAGRRVSPLLDQPTLDGSIARPDDVLDLSK